MPRLTTVTFTGVDDFTDISRLQDIQKRYPYVEFGVLVSESRQGTETRYPSRDFLRMIPRSGLNLSVHLCGSLARNAVQGNFLPAELAIGSLRHHVRRIQLNVATWKDCPDRIIYVPHWCPEMILQQKSAENCPLFINSVPLGSGGRLSVLLDASGGRGIDTPVEVLQGPYKVGYAGGFGPENVRRKLTEILSDSRTGDFWIDMENRVRTEDRFDLDKVETVLQEVTVTMNAFQNR